MAPPLTLDGRAIGAEHPPYIIAEMSANHGGSLDRALAIIRLAKQAGADAIKFQAYTADSITLDSDRPEFFVTGDDPWSGKRLFDLYKVAATPYDWFPTLFETARSIGITPFCAPFDLDAVAMLENLDCPAYKIASCEMVDLDLIRRCAATGKPVIVSTGMASAEEINRAVDAASTGAGGVGLLKCTSAYPADPAESNLATIPDMMNTYDLPVGLSDHTLGAAIPVAAVALGACMIEKHFIDAPEPPTADSSFSATPDVMRALVDGCRAAWQSRGAVRYGPTLSEQANVALRRSLYANCDIEEGHSLTGDMVASYRPAAGLPPHQLDRIIGKKANRRIAKDEPLSLDMFE